MSRKYKNSLFCANITTKMINFNLSILYEHARFKLIFCKAVQNFYANVNVNENKHLLCQRIICLSKSLRFCPNQNLSNKGIKQTKNSRELYWSVIGVQYSVLWRGFSDRKLAVPPELKPLSPEPNWSGNFCFFGRKNLRGKTGFCRILSAFFVTVSLLMPHYGQANLLNQANFLKVALQSST